MGGGDIRRPLVGLCIIFGIGIWVGIRWGGMVNMQSVVLVSACLAWGISLLFLLLRRNHLSALGMYLLVCLLGLLLSSRSDDKADFSGIFNETAERIDCTVAGLVNQDIVERIDRTETGRLQFGLLCDSITADGLSHSVSEPVYVTLYGVPVYPPVYGERWQLEGTLVKGRTRGSGQATWRFYTGLRRAKRCARPGRSLPVWSHMARREASAILSAGIETMTDVTGVINALVLGYRTRLPEDVQRSFSSTGTMHIFAISGLHVGILCSILVFAIGLLRLPRTCWVLPLAPVIALYTFTTGSRASAIRASIMAIAYLLAPLLGRRPDALSAMALAGICILTWQPDQLLEIGFIFSFAAVAGILAMVPIFEVWLQRWLRPNAMVARGLVRQFMWWRVPVLWLGRLASVSMAAWLTSVPLSLYFFGRFSPIALAANLIVIPLAFLILVTGCLSLVSGACIGLWLAGIFNFANVVFVRFLVGGMRFLEKVPFGHAEDMQISRLDVAIWYALLGYAIVRLRNSSPQPHATENDFDE